MTAKIIDGKALAAKCRQELTETLAKHNHHPHLAVVLVGNDEASLIYDRNKQKAAIAAGMKCDIHHLDENTPEVEVLELINKLNDDTSIHGVMVQLPLPKHLNAAKILESVRQDKDVDGFTAMNSGLLQLKDSRAVIAATPKGIIKLLETEMGDLSGKHAVIIGRSNIVGRPLASALLNRNCTVTVVHSKTHNIQDVCRQGDILVAACGCPKIVKKDWVKKGAVIIDVGINRIDGQLCGDVDFDDVAETASAITPVPGGVGPMTIAMLLENTYQAYLAQKGLKK